MAPLAERQTPIFQGWVWGTEELATEWNQETAQGAQAEGGSASTPASISARPQS